MTGRSARRIGARRCADPRSTATATVVTIGVMLLAARVDAHRLDEYLQATRLAVAADRIDVEMDLSPGVAVAPLVIGAIDIDGDGRIAPAEARAYAAAVAAAVTLSIDGRPVPLHVDGRVFASPEAMREGGGTIRLALSAPVAVGGGRHRLAFVNAHLPASSAYLVNALVPADRRITFGAPARDIAQRTFTMDYDVGGARAGLGWSGAAVAMVGLLVAARRRTSRS